MRHILLLLFAMLTIQAIAQYPATGNKMRLGWQTTGDGLVYRGAIGDTATLDPSGLNNAWMLLDTANGNLYAYRAKAWRLVSGGGGSVSDTLTGEVKGPLDSTYIDTVANIIFTTTTDTTVGVGELEYNDTQGSLVQGLKGGNVTNVIGQQIHQRVTNATGGPLTKGTAVFLHGSQGNRITVRKALATVDSTSANTFGIVAESIADNQSGYVITEGLITNMNTNALTEGAAVYLSPTVAGELTTTKPQAPQHTVYIGVCVKQNAGNGELFVKIRNGQELDELHDVRIDSPVSNASLYYNAAQGVWRDTTAAVLTSDTSVFARDFQISGTAGQVAYFNAANAITSDTAFRWSAANKALGINTNTTPSGAQVIVKVNQVPSRSTAVATQTFSADTTNWTRGTGWTFNGTAAVATAATGNLTYTPALTITSGNAYEVTYTISGYSAGTLTVAVGNTTYLLPSHNTTANIVVLFPTAATGGFRFTTSTFTGNLDNVSVVQVANPASIVFSGQHNSPTDQTLWNPVSMSGSTNYSVGGGARYSTGLGNVVFGQNSGLRITTGSGNVILGNGSAPRLTSGYGNVVFGNEAFLNATTAYANTIIGREAGLTMTTGFNNNIFGQQAGRGMTTGNSNNIFGTSGGYSMTTGSANNIFGDEAAYGLTTGNNNNLFGTDAGRALGAGSDNNLFGNRAGEKLTGSGNNFFGLTAGINVTTGNRNTLIGENAGSAITTGSQNIIVGYLASGSNGTNNVGIGQEVMRNGGTGSNNTALGNGALRTVGDGNGNVAIGLSAGQQFASDFNIAIGHLAGSRNNQADSLTGNSNIVIGYQAADNIITTAAANVAIGNQVDLPTNNGSNQGVYQNVLFFTGASGTGTTIAAGSRAGIKTNAPASDFHVAGEVRIDDLKPTGTPRNIVGSSSTGDLSTMAWGNGLTVSVGDTVLRVDTSLILPKVNVSGTTNYLAKFTAGNRVGNSVLFDNGTNVGLGTASPTAKFDLRGGIYQQDGDVRLAVNSGNVGISTAGVPESKLHLGSGGLMIDGPGTLDPYLDFRINTVKIWTIGVDNSDSDKFKIADGGGSNNLGSGDKFTIDGSGNVGIATASPSRPLHVAGTSAIRIPVGNLAERGTSGAGDIRVRNDTANLEFHNGTSWQTVATQSYVTDNAISTVYIPINLYAPGDTVANTTNSKAFFLVHGGLNGYCIDSYTVKAFSGSGTADIQIDKNGTGANTQAISGTTVATKDTNIALATGDYIRGQVFNLSGTLVGLGLTLEIKKTCN